jgi:hypothetical protein
MVEFVLGSKSKVTINTFLFCWMFSKYPHYKLWFNMPWQIHTKNFPDRSKNKKQNEPVNYTVVFSRHCFSGLK